MKKLILGILFLVLVGCKVNLYSGLSEVDANAITALLLAHDISVEKSAGAEGTWTLMIDEGNMVRAVALLDAHGLPKEKFTSLGEVFKKEGMISTPLEEKVRFMYALSQEVASTIAQLDGVLVARVHVVPQEQDSLGTNILPASASVFIKYSAEADIESQVPKIKVMVENSIGGLKKENVSVFLFQATPNIPPPIAESSKTTILIFSGIGLLIVIGAGTFIFITMQQRKAGIEEV
ncbi:MAG: type III secretion inner membrane ring lipoprotein SctJ [Desulfovibrionaceae bacterium]|nr:type III secretion inner membrane ring lipoprotein SctJ [Desulfovibrionaceae bacterium]